jgi:hypothetical protein
LNARRRIESKVILGIVSGAKEMEGNTRESKERKKKRRVSQ